MSSITNPVFGRRRHRRRVLAVASAVVSVGLIAACSSSGGGTPPAGTGGGSGAASGAGGSADGAQCGENVYVPPTQVGAVFQTLPTSVQKLYSNWPFPLEKSPWADSKPVQGPWKLAFIAPPITGSYYQNVLNELKSLFAEYKQKGLVTGDLQVSVQTSAATATPEQQIQAVQQAVRNGYNGIFMETLNPDALAPAVEAAGKAGVPVVNVFNVVLGTTYGVNEFSQTSPPTYAGVLKQIGGKGNVINLRGAAGSTTEAAFNKSLLEAVARCPKVKIVATLQGDWTDSGAKTVILQYLASHPGQKIDAVLQNGGTGVGIIQAFEQAGKPVPPISFGGCTGGCLNWWAQHKSSYSSTGTVATGAQVAYTSWSIMMRILAGNGLKVDGISIDPPVITNENVSDYAVPGEDLNYPGEGRGPVDAWGGSDEYLDQFFVKPGTPGH